MTAIKPLQFHSIEAMAFQNAPTSVLPCGSSLKRSQLDNRRYRQNPKLPGNEKISLFNRPAVRLAGGRSSISGPFDANGHSTPPASGSGANFEGPAVALKAASKIKGTQTGILKSGVHLVDMVLDIGPGLADGKLPAFEQYLVFVNQLMRDIEAQNIPHLNEKIDGAPSIVLGKDVHGIPFVGYKEHLLAPDKIVRSAAEAQALHGNRGLGEILPDCIEPLKEGLLKHCPAGTVFQADLLFAGKKGFRELTDAGFVCRPNATGITYQIPHDAPYYEAINKAKIAFVMHTAARLHFDSETGHIVGSSTIEDHRVVSELVAQLHQGKVFAIDPWSANVAVDLDESNRFLDTDKSDVMSMLTEMQAAMTALSPNFRKKMRGLLPLFSTYFNSGLKAGEDGGFFKVASKGVEFDGVKLISDFRFWLERRTQFFKVTPAGGTKTLTPKNKLTALDRLIEHQSEELNLFLRSYFQAIRLQSLLQNHMQEALVSKLGSRPIEGLMLTDPSSGVKVKLVDRLGFTLENFSKSRRRQKLIDRPQASAAKKSTPQKIKKPYRLFENWQAGAYFYLCKLQPLHVGHVSLVSSLLQEPHIDQLHIIASNKRANLVAMNWKDMGVAPTRSAFNNGNFEHAFSVGLRRDLFKAAALPRQARYHSVAISEFRKYLERAKEARETGKINLIVGQKEQNRYDAWLKEFPDHLNLIYRDLHADSISATQVRLAIKKLAIDGDPKAFHKLTRALAYIEDEVTRNKMIYKLVSEWNAVQHEVKVWLHEETIRKTEAKALRAIKSKKSKKAKA